MAVQMVNCCCCIPLKAGVVVISILWLLYGIYNTANDISYIVNINEDSATVIPEAIVYAFVSIGAAFGLFAVTFANTSKMLFIYTKIAYGIAAVDIIDRISDVVFIAVYGRDNLDCGDYATREQCYNYTLSGYIMTTIILGMISVYFAMVVSAYAYKRKGKEDAARVSSGQTNGDLPRTSYDKIQDDLKK